MGEFLGFLLVVSFIGWGTAFTALHFFRRMRRLDEGVDREVTARLLEDVDQLSTRLSQVEEELAFFKELRAPENRPGLPSSREPDELEEGGDQG